MAYRAKDIGKLLASVGVKVLGTVEAHDVEDGQVDLIEGYHVQVGNCYLCLVHQIGESFAFNAYRSKLEELCDDICSAPALSTTRLRKLCGRCTCVEDPDEPCAMHGMKRA